MPANLTVNISPSQVVALADADRIVFEGALLRISTVVDLAKISREPEKALKAISRILDGVGL